MELVKNVIFDENMLYEDILRCVVNMRNYIDKEDEVKEKYISKMYGNVFALLLRNGLSCGKEETEEGTFYCMNINDEIYKCDEMSLKNYLFKDFNDIISKALH